MQLLVEKASSARQRTTIRYVLVCNLKTKFIVSNNKFTKSYNVNDEKTVHSI